MTSINIEDLETGIGRIVSLQEQIEKQQNELKEEKIKLCQNLNSEISNRQLKPIIIDMLVKEEGKTSNAAQQYYRHILVTHRFWNLGFIQSLLSILQSGLEESEKGSQGASNNLLLAATG